MLDLGGIKKNISEIEERIVHDRRERGRRQQQVIFLLDRIEARFQKRQEELSTAYKRIELLESMLQEVATAIEKLAGHSQHFGTERDDVLERVLDLDRKFNAKAEPTAPPPNAAFRPRGPQRTRMYRGVHCPSAPVKPGSIKPGSIKPALIRPVLVKSVRHKSVQIMGEAPPIGRLRAVPHRQNPRAPISRPISVPSRRCSTARPGIKPDANRPETEGGGPASMARTRRR